MLGALSLYRPSAMAPPPNQADHGGDGRATACCEVHPRRAASRDSIGRGRRSGVARLGMTSPQVENALATCGYASCGACCAAAALRGALGRGWHHWHDGAGSLALRGALGRGSRPRRSSRSTCMIFRPYQWWSKERAPVERVGQICWSLAALDFHGLAPGF